MKKTCDTCLCCSVCKYKDKNTLSACESWIGATAVIDNERNSDVPTTLLIETALSTDNTKYAEDLINREINAYMEAFQKILSCRYKCDWPLVLTAMKAFAQYKLSQMTPESKKLAELFGNGIRFFTINLNI